MRPNSSSSDDPVVARRIERLASICIGRLAIVPVRAPLKNEAEPRYSAAVLGAEIKRFVRKLEVPGLHVGGDGTGPVAVAPFLGCLLKPDITILSFALRVLAVEIKIVRVTSLSSDISKAVGQASLYQAFGFARSAILLVDRDGAIDHSEISVARERLQAIKIALIVRRTLAGKLSIDENNPYMDVTSSS